MNRLLVVVKNGNKFLLVQINADGQLFLLSPQYEDYDKVAKKANLPSINNLFLANTIGNKKFYAVNKIEQIAVQQWTQRNWMLLFI